MIIAVNISEENISVSLEIKREKRDEIFSFTRDDLEKSLTGHGVVCGIRYNILDEICDKKITGESKVVAEYIPPQDGRNARVEILKKSLRIHETTPPQSEQGEVDYISPRDGLFVYARKGEVLAVKHAALKGVPGKDVCGGIISGKPGKDIDLELFAGDGTVIAGDHLIADSDGFVTVDGTKVNVSRQYTLHDNVGMNTGSIDLPLDLDIEIVVEGDIQSGFYVSCNSLSVSGTIEDARVTVGVLKIKEGIVGTGSEELVADSIEVGYINGTRKIRTNVINVAKEISGGAEIYATVVRAFTIRGSFVAAKEALWIDYINGKNTIVVGVDYESKLNYDQLSKKIAELQNPIEELKEQGLLNAKKMKKLSELAKINPRHPLLKQELPKIREAKVRLDNYLNFRAELLQKREEIAQTMYSKKEPFLFVERGFSNDSSAGNTVEPNILITIGEHVMKIDEKIRGGLFSGSRNGITHSVNYNIKEISMRMEALRKDESQKSLVKN